MGNPIFLLGIFTCLLYACNIKEQSEIQTEVLAATQVIQIDAEELVNSFVQDSNAASKKYIGKILSVKGTVAHLEQIEFSGKVNDSLPAPLKWLTNRLLNDINTSNIFYKEIGVADPLPSYNLQATFPREYREELVGIQEKSKVTIKGKLEHITTFSQNLSDSSKKVLLYTLSLQGCLVE
jgi:hypothetical protein